MEQTGLSAIEVAKAAGTTRQAVYMWMSGETKSLKGETLVGAARALKTTPDWLGFGRGEELPGPDKLGHGLTPEAVDLARAWMRLPDYKRRGYAQGIMVDAAVVEVFPELERAMRTVAVATDPSYHKMTERFAVARDKIVKQGELDLKIDP